MFNLIVIAVILLLNLIGFSFEIGETNIAALIIIGTSTAYLVIVLYAIFLNVIYTKTKT